MPARLSILLCCTLIFLSPVRAAGQTALPDQMIYEGLESDPISDRGGGPLRLITDWMEFPDHRHGTRTTLSWWTKIRKAHGARVAFDYVGVESQDLFRYGGGRTRLRWTSRFGDLHRRGIAIDLAGDFPVGDPTLFPLSTAAPMAIVRLRGSLLRQGPFRIWAGWWARRVSPPSERKRQDPLTAFASGTGFDGLLEVRTGRVDLNAMLHLPTGGPRHRVFHWTLDADWWFTQDFAFRTGVALDTGPRQERSRDWALRLGALWRPGGEGPDG